MTELRDHRDEALTHRVAEMLCATRRAARAWWVTDRMIDAASPRAVPILRMLTREVAHDVVREVLTEDQELLRELIDAAVDARLAQRGAA